MTLRELPSVSPPEECPRCHDTGFTIVVRDGYDYAAPCGCREAAPGRSRSSVPARFQEARFENFATQTPSLKRARTTVQEFAKRYPAVECGLFLMGPEGIGKTHLACALLNLLLSRGIPGLYYGFGDLLEKLRRSFDRDSGISKADVLDPILDAQLVVIDGIGDEKPTEWVHETLSHIVNHRYNHKLVTVATSRFFDRRTAGELGAGAAGGQRRESEEKGAALTLEERIGTSLLSRFYEMCQFVPMQGPDYRVHIKTAAFKR